MDGMPADQVASVAAEAADLYRRGVELLARGEATSAVPVLRGAVAIDDRFALANAALAVAEDAVGNAAERRAALGRAAAQRQISRRERQHVAVIALALDGKLARASALGREHLGEFAADILVLHVLTARGVDVADLDKDHADDMSQVDRHVAAETEDGTFRPS